MGTRQTNPLACAVQLKRRVAIEALLERGADIDVTVTSPYNKKVPTVSLFDIAVSLYEFKEVLTLLLENDMHIPHISHWPSQGTTYNSIRECVLLRSRDTGDHSLELLEFKEFKRLARSGELELYEC
jgi:hypothetical protein